MKHLVRGLILTAAVISTPALAADVIVDAPAPLDVAPSFTWAGGYIGGQIGYLDATDSDNTIVGTNAGAVVVGGRDTTADGFIGGIHAGYNFDLGGFVAGVYGDVDFSSASVDLQARTAPLPGPVLNGVGDVDYIARGLVKAGYAVDRVFGYAQGGIAFVDLDIDTSIGGEIFDADLDSYGYAVGVGVDFAVTNNVTVGGDYLFHNFSDFDDVTGSLGTTISSSALDLDAHTFRAKFAYKF